MYIATMAQATAIAEGNLPKYLKNVVRRNEKKNCQKNQNYYNIKYNKNWNNEKIKEEKTI